MRLTWQSTPGGGEQHAPVEMRFIDMFMTALGSLLFLALLLVALLPKISDAAVKGVIVAKDDRSITIETAKDGRKKVFLDQQTEIAWALKGAAGDLQLGQTVTATGLPNTDGSIAASALQIRFDVDAEVATLVREIEKLRAEINRLKERVAALESQVAQLSQENSMLREENERLRDKVAELERQNAQLAQENASLKQEIARLNERIAQLSQENAGLKQEVARLNERVAQLAQENASLKQEITRLNDRIAQLTQENSNLRAEVARLNKMLEQSRTEDANIRKRWFGVNVFADGCRDADLFFYVRYEGKLVHPETGKPAPDAKTFDAADVVLASYPDLTARTRVVGDHYHDIVGPPLGGHQLAGGQVGKQLKVFHSVARGQASYSTYVALRDPRNSVNKECVVYPVFLTWGKSSLLAQEIALTPSRPFAWLRRFEVKLDGTNTLDDAPKDDRQFLRDLSEFSKDQSQRLCTQRSICGTEDAHLYALRAAATKSEPPPTPSKFTRHPNKAFKYSGEAASTAKSLEDCENRCLTSASCVGYTYFRKAERSKLSQQCRLMENAGQELLDDSRADSATKAQTAGIDPKATGSALFQRLDNIYFEGYGYQYYLNSSYDRCEIYCGKDEKCRAFELHKPTGNCRLYDRVPTRNPSAGYDVGIRR